MVLRYLSVFFNILPITGLWGFQTNPRFVHIPTSLHSLAAPITTTTIVDIDENAPREIWAMQEWANVCGAQMAQGFQLVCDDEYGRDIYAMTTEDLPANTDIMFVPEQMILSSNKAMDELRSQEMESSEQFIKSLNVESELRHYYLILKILVEYEKGEDSPWFPWLNSMPRYYSNAVSMTPICFECLSSLTKKLAMEERTNLFNLSIKEVPFLNSKTKGNVDLWTFAYQIVYTRAFEANDGSGDLRIVPMGDFFNHGTDTEINFAYDEEGNYWAQTSYDVPAGSPLRMSYGDPTNPSFLLARYGFLDETSPATFCKIFPPHINKDMKTLGYAQNRMLFYKETGDVSQEVWDILLYQWLSSKKKGEEKALMKAHVEEDYGAKMALHEKYFDKTSSLLLEHIDSFLERLDKLTEKSKTKDVSKHPRLPLIMRHNEFVRETFLTVRNRYFGY